MEQQRSIPTCYESLVFDREKEFIHVHYQRSSTTKYSLQTASAKRRRTDDLLRKVFQNRACTYEYVDPRRPRSVELVVELDFYPLDLYTDKVYIKSNEKDRNFGGEKNLGNLQWESNELREVLLYRILI